MRDEDTGDEEKRRETERGVEEEEKNETEC